MKKLVLLLLIIITLASCGAREEKTAATTDNSAAAAKQAMQFYEEFLDGKRNAFFSYEDGLHETDFAMKSWKDYAFFDVNDDSIPELHVREIGSHSVFMCMDGELIVWRALGPYEQLLNNGAILYMRNNLYYIDYAYIEYDFYGNEQLRISFQKGIDLSSDNPNYNEISEYFFEDEQVTKEEWETLTEKYFLIGSDEIEWISVDEQ